jgi:hypothetical protein
MRLDRYSAIDFSGLSPADLAPALATWVVPDGAGRWRRQEQGILSNWQTSSLLASDDLVGNDGCVVKARWSTDQGEYLLRFVHRDEAPGIMWSTMFRLSRHEHGTLLEAAVARDAPRGVYLEPKAGAPWVVMDLIRRHEDTVRPRELVLPPLNLKVEADVEALVDQLLLAPGRTVPVVVVARDIGDAQAVVDLGIIARRMQGIAVVASLDGRDNTFAFGELLRQRGADAGLQCFNGGVHTYGPTATLERDHRLWLRRSLETLPEEIRSEYVGETLARHLSLDQAPPGFLFAIEDFDRRERERLRSTRSIPPQGASPDASLVEQLRADLAVAEQLLVDAANAENELRAVAQRLETVDLELSTERMLRESLQDQLSERRAAAAAASIAPELRDGMRLVACRLGAPSPKQSLEILEALFPDRIAVLPEALESAEIDGPRFRKPDEVWGLLLRLCTGYYEGLLRGGDTVAKQVFSQWEFVPHGSGPEVNSTACERDRTRRYKGQTLVLWPHLRAGGKGAPEDCLRIHFVWVPDERRLVIGHCGKHLREA